MSLIEYSGLLYRLDPLLSPVLGLLGFSAPSVLPLIVGLFAGIYAGIATMTALSLNMAEQTLVAVFLLISHNLIQEGIVQDRSGLSFWKATITRLAASIAAVIAVAWLMDSPSSPNQTQAAASFFREPFSEFAAAWATSTGILAVKMFVILLPLMVLLEMLKVTGGISVLVKLIAPLLRLLGLNGKAGAMWLTGAVFGLSYGAAVIMEEARSGRFSGQDLEELQVSVGINHAMIEDPLLFLALGISPLWVWLPRLAAAVAAVYMWRTLKPLRRRLGQILYICTYSGEIAPIEGRL